VGLEEYINVVSLERVDLEAGAMGAEALLIG
jgi:hypothetical protein